MSPRPVSLAALALLLVVSTATAACGGSSKSSSSACGKEVHEPLDSRSTQHVLPGAPEPAYKTDPPTSGPHRIGAAPPSVSPDPIDRPLQVHLLEDGGVLLQYRSSADGDQLKALAGGEVTVAPNPTLPAPVVATAWTVKLSCSAVDPAALRAFVKAHAGKGAGHG